MYKYAWTQNWWTDLRDPASNGSEHTTKGNIYKTRVG